MHLITFIFLMIQPIMYIFMIKFFFFKFLNASMGMHRLQLVEHNRSYPLGFVWLLNSILKISYMATGFIKKNVIS